MSRICVKNLPKDVTEGGLRHEFSQKGVITDVKLMRTKDGKSRQFAFIGFQTEHDAQVAIEYFNKSRLKTSRITCEVAKNRGDTNLPRPWSRYSKMKDNKVTTPDAEKHARGKGQGNKFKDIVDITDPQLQDFLEVMRPRTKSKLWENDTSVVSNVSHIQEISHKNSKGKSDAIHPILVQSGPLVDELPNNPELEPEPSKSRELEHDEVLCDIDYFNSRVTKEWSDSDSSDGDDSVCINDDDDKDIHSLASQHDKSCDNYPFDTCGEGVAHDRVKLNATEQGGQSSNPEDEKVFESCRLFVRNLPYTTTEEELQNHFSKFQCVSEPEVHIVVDKDTKQSKGIAFIHFSSSEFAARALKEFDNSTFQGRILHVMPALQRPSNNEENNVSKDQNSKTLKQRREEARKAAEARGDTRAWNSLFMRPDTVVENVARKYGISKSDLLDPEADDLAVRVALGEIQVISETKKALANAGVNVESLEELANGNVDGLKRSSHVILVKNLQYGSTEDELAKKFGGFTILDKIILPPTKILALVVFLEPAKAKAAFENLAYTCYRGAPLYLEWAPSNIFSQSSTLKNNEMNSGIGKSDVRQLILEQNVERISDVDIDPDRVEARSLFVKNLNFKTTDESLRKHFSEHMKEGNFLSVKVKKKHLKNGENVSMGFGFVEFDSVETATNVCSGLQRTVLDGHALILQLCRVKNDGQIQKTVEKGKSSTKLLVRNVAFESTKEELRDFFSSGDRKIKSLRLPMKFGGHRGFCFVEYSTPQEAQNALVTFSGTHLRGHRLVIERAKEGESLDELRARTAAKFSESNGFLNASKLSKKRKHIIISDEA